MTDKSARGEASLLKAHYRKKLERGRVALTGLQLLEKARKAGWKIDKHQVSRFLRQEEPPVGPSWARKDKVDQYQGTVAFKPGVYFVDYGEFHKGWSRSNGGATGFLVAVENLTNKLFVLPTRGKDTSQWLEAVARFVEATRQVSVIYSDRDSVASKAFRDRIEKKYGAKWYFIKKGHKSYLAERYVGFVKTKLSQVLESDPDLLASKNWTGLVAPLVSEYNKQLVPGTSFPRQSVSRENFNAFLSQLFKSPDYDLQITGRVLGSFAQDSWNKKVFRFDLGDRVRVAGKADWTDPESRKQFRKVSVLGSYGRKFYTVSGRQLRATRDGRTLVPVYQLLELSDNSEKQGGGGFVFYENELLPAKTESH